MKKRKVITVLLAICMLLGGTACGSTTNDGEGSSISMSSDENLGGNSEDFDAGITSTTHETAIALLDGAIYEFAANYEKGKSVEYADGYEREDRFAPKPALIVWDNVREDVLSYTVKLGLKKDLSDAKSYTVDQNILEIEDLFSAKRYYYQICAHYESGEESCSQVFHFNTMNLPRTIAVEGVSNTRDIGGRFTTDGKYQVKQGMIYRGGEVNASWGKISDAGKAKMLYTYGIKTDLDLRGTHLAESPLNDGKTIVNYVNVSAPYYMGNDGIFSETYKDALITEIRTFADPDNYPIYLHCSLGRDRAGTLAFLINALLGVSKQDLYMDYETSFFSINGFADAAQGSGKIPVLLNALDVLYDGVTSFGGDNLAAATEQFMVEYLGIAQEEVDMIRNIMLEEIGE